MKLDAPAFAYRRSPVIEGVPDDKLVFVYDGVCVLCSGGARMVAARDRHDRIRFVSGQSPLGRALFRRYGLPDEAFTEQLVLWKGEAFTGFNGMAETILRLPFNWMYPAVLLRYLPFQHRLYRFMARHRFRLFGRRDACMVPPEALRSRFLA